MSVDDTLQLRGNRYGDFSIHAEIAQNLQDDMRGTKGWERLSPTQKQALTVIADKIARILSGDPNYDDNWHDIQGYAKLVEDRLVDVSKDPIVQLEEKHFTESITVPLPDPGDVYGALGKPMLDATGKIWAQPNFVYSQ
jgi:hypothetical protein